MCRSAVQLQEGSADYVESFAFPSASVVVLSPLPDPLRLAHPSTLVSVWSLWSCSASFGHTGRLLTDFILRGT